MEGDSYTDPLAALLRPTVRPRFASLDWAVWDGNQIFDPDMQSREDGPRLALVAGTTYVRQAVSIKRPETLSKHLDNNTLNYLARWGIKGFLIGEERASERIEGDHNLLDSYRSGVLLALSELRKAKVPDNVNKKDLKEVIDALEFYTHGHYVEMAEIGPGIAARIRAENVLAQQFMAMKMAQNSEDHEGGEESDGEDTDDSKLQDRPGTEEANQQEHKDAHNDTNTTAKDFGNGGENDNGDDDESTEYFDEVLILEEIDSSSDDNEERGKDDDTEASSVAEKEAPDETKAPHQEETVRSKRGQRAKSKKAKKAKTQAKRNKKDGNAPQAET